MTHIQESPAWWQGVIYQIYPRSFADSNGDGVGDLNGIRSKLDYLAGLGVDALWLSPVYPSPDADFGYDVSDFCAVDPRYGSLADFDALLAEAHTRGLRVMIDLVLNHSSDQHPWFVESRSSRANPRRDWYIWADPTPRGGPPNNWPSCFGGSAWQLDPATGQMYLHTFFKEQPDLNWRCPAVRAALLDVFRFWLERGVDGFRLDAFSAYFKHPELRDNPTHPGIPGVVYTTQSQVNNCNLPDMLPLLREIRALVDSYSSLGRERYLVGEPFFSDARAAAGYCGPDLLHATFDFEPLLSPWSARRLTAAIQRWQHLLGDQTWPNFVFNNHDNPRTATRWRRHLLSLTLFGSANLNLFPVGPAGDDARLKQAAALLLTLRGTAFLYYGEEIGMRDIPVRSKAEARDPLARAYWPFSKGRDGCRAPMQWDASPNAGFTTHPAPWLPVNADYPTRSAAAQSADPASLLNFYRRLTALRRASPALAAGMFQPVTFGTRHIVAYLRQTQEQVMLVAFNFGARPRRLVLGSHLARTGWRVRLGTHRAEGEIITPAQSGPISLAGREALILEMEK